MVLTTQQRKHLFRVFNQFIRFARRYLDERGLISPGFDMARRPHADELREIVEAIWGEGGHKEVFDAFKVDPDVKLSERDRNLVLSDWRDAFLDTFVVWRRGNDTLLIFDEYAFAVRGIEEEIDEALPELPVRVRCALVPFGPAITYLVLMDTVQTRFSNDFKASLPARVDAMEEWGHIAYIPNQYERLAPEARENRRRNDERYLYEGAKDEEFLGPLSAGEHRGVLAGLSWEERQRRFAEDSQAILDAWDPAYVREALAKRCLKGRPQRALPDIVGRYGLTRLREIAFDLGLMERVSKEELVDFLVGAHPVRGPEVLKFFCRLGPDFLSSLRRVVEAGGLMPLDLAAIEEGTDDLPVAVFPWLSYFRQGTVYVVVAPDELVRALEGCDWDAWERTAAAIDDAISWLSVALTYRGVIELSEATAAACGRFSGVEAGELEMALRQRMASQVSQHLVEVVEGVTYLIAEDYLVPREEGFDDLVLDLEGIHATLAGRAGIEARWPTAEEGASDIVLTCLELPEVRSLMQYLDAHVPDDADDFLFASIVLGAIISVSRLGVAPLDELEGLVHALGKAVEQERRILELAGEALEVLPNRLLNGQTRRHCREP